MFSGCTWPSACFNFCISRALIGNSVDEAKRYLKPTVSTENVVREEVSRMEFRRAQGQPSSQKRPGTPRRPACFSNSNPRPRTLPRQRLEVRHGSARCCSHLVADSGLRSFETNTFGVQVQGLSLAELVLWLCLVSLPKLYLGDTAGCRLQNCSQPV